MTKERDLAEARGRYDALSDAFAIRFAPAGAKYDTSEEVAHGVVLDFDVEGQIIAIEVLSVSLVFRSGDDPPWTQVPPDALQQALEAYVVAFDGEHVPFLRDIGEAEEMAVATAMLRHAVAKRRPLVWGAIMAALGYPPPLSGSLPGPTLAEAEDAYLARFGQDAAIWPFLCHNELPAALLEAAERGEPWTVDTLEKRLGVPPPLPRTFTSPPPDETPE